MIYATPEHTLLRDQVARFIAAEVEPHAAQWEEAGATPREVLRKPGAIGRLGLMVDPAHGGMGYIRATAKERLWRDARVPAIGGGATEVMLEEAAKRM